MEDDAAAQVDRDDLGFGAEKADECDASVQPGKSGACRRSNYKSDSGANRARNDPVKAARRRSCHISSASRKPHRPRVADVASRTTTPLTSHAVDPAH